MEGYIARSDRRRGKIADDRLGYLVKASMKDYIAGYDAKQGKIAYDWWGYPVEARQQVKRRGEWSKDSRRVLCLLDVH